MCGIGGILLPTDQVVSDSQLRQMANAMHHRGPDSSGTWTHSGVGFAHTRLSLVDLSDAAAQPWSDGTDAMVFNGEIYNYRDLRRELEAVGDHFITSSDTEVLFALVRRHGIDAALGQLRGMFGFAYFQASSNTTFLCRDRFGIKPLVYVPAAGGIAFASEVKALAAITAIEVDDTLALFTLRALGDKSMTRTLFRGIQQVSPGGIVAVRAGTVVSCRTFATVLDGVDPERHRRLEQGGFDAAVSEFQSLMDASVDRMMACDARLGTLLSGGVDSALITSIAARKGPQDLRAFTSDVQGSASEVDLARSIADSLHVPFRSVPFAPEQWITDWVQATWHLETPVITNPSSLPFAQVARLAHKDGYKAVLTGEGADELFLGYPRMASGAAESLATAPIRALRSVYGRVPGLLDAVLNDRDNVTNDFVRGIMGGFEDDRLTTEALERYSFLGTREAHLQAASAVMVQTSLQALLQRNDRMAMAHSVESRFPFLDEDLVAFAVNVPSRFKLRRTRTLHDPKHPFIVDKALVRAGAKPYLTSEQANRRKNGFPTRGLHGITVRPGAFAGGWAATTFGASQSFDHEIATWHQSYDPAKLMSLEIFGRLFARGESIETVESWVHANAELAP